MNLNNEIKLAIIDDYFPNIKTGFRVAEFNWYMKNLKEVRVFSTSKAIYKFIDEYSYFYPEYTQNIKPLTSKNVHELNYFDVLYTVFASNTFEFLEYFNYAKKPFVFTLYPGGGFLLDNIKSDNKLKAIFNNPYFYKVIVTQKISYDYLINKKLVLPEQIEFMYGGVTNSPVFSEDKKLYIKDKNTFDICFVANKYQKNDRSKGYDIFIDVCHELMQICDDIMFHVVGGFNVSDIDISKLGNNIKFYGTRNVDFFPGFYSEMDIMISPTRPFEILKGGFDGFPTTCCVDAALNGTQVFTTDKLNLNTCFTDGKDICIINEDVDEIVNKVMYYKNNLDLLYSLSLNTQKKFNEVFGLDNQMMKRMKVLNNAIQKND